jgi:pyruvate/2-oxoglutarate/acetoin dehydrogenase E1 component
MREWLLETNIATDEQLKEIEEKAKQNVMVAKNAAWKEYITPILHQRDEVIDLIDTIAMESDHLQLITNIKNELATIKSPIRKEIYNAAKKVLRLTRTENINIRTQLIEWLNKEKIANYDRYGSHLYSESEMNATKVVPVKAEFEGEQKIADGRVLLRENFDCILAKYPEVVIFGEDSGKIGGVNQGLEDLQAKYGEARVFDTGIREATIIGQAIGLSLRGFRPIAEIQYLDYLLYALQILSDDLACLQYRTKGMQKAPIIIRTRGHRLEGIFHSGSPMGMIINALRGIYVCVPRNMTQAAGFYNTILAGDEPALVIESLNSYRLKEQVPSNIGKFRVPLGVVETLKEGNDVTLVTYGSCCKLAMEAAKALETDGISIEVIDVQTLLPFDLNKQIVESVKKTNRLLVLDEDVPGGASAYILQKVLEGQDAYQYLDSLPKTLSAKAHRPAYTSDGDYISKPSADDIYDAVYDIMHEADPESFPEIY